MKKKRNQEELKRKVISVTKSSWVAVKAELVQPYHCCRLKNLQVDQTLSPVSKQPFASSTHNHRSADSAPYVINYKVTDLKSGHGHCKTPIAMQERHLPFLLAHNLSQNTKPSHESLLR
ncbi:hypothetical protein V6N12_072012 [Hibiscus sabdariffa]|uniref:Uncharacterized protein n=1 Tax=Hibiscus sabdariffa TaxID=183260 RepID=A0ABR2FLG5_9ROSI